MAFSAFLKSLKAHALVDAKISQKSYVALDLSLDNPNLNCVNVSSSKDLERFIWSHISRHNAKVAYGGYLEKRGIYSRSTYFNQSKPETERNIHLGMDLWIASGSPIYAPLKGEIHSFKNNSNYGDYGPTIILKHHLENHEFFTLYGHLSLESIADIQVGMAVTQGDKFATLGTAEVNGNYPPHLHFQIIKDIQNFEGDYPGVSNILDLEFYKQNCPNPNLLLDLG